MIPKLVQFILWLADGVIYDLQERASSRRSELLEPMVQ